MEEKDYDDIVESHEFEVEDLNDEIKLLNLALDHLISQTTGKEITDPDIQRIKQGLINKVKEAK